MSWLLWHSTQPRSKIWLCVLSANFVANTVWQVPQTLVTAPTPGGAAPWLPWQSLQVGADRSLRVTMASWCTLPLVLHLLIGGPAARRLRV